MIVIVPVENQSGNQPVCPSFGRAPLFLLLDTENGTQQFLDNSAAATQGGAGIKAAQIIADSGAKALITYRCGENAAKVLNMAGIQIYQAMDGSAQENINEWKAGTLSLLSQIHSGFHHHGGAGQ